MKFNFIKDLFDGKGRPAKTDITRRFELLGRVGQGSMSRVWRARDTQSGKVVGLKVLDKEKTERFESRFAPELKKPSEGEIAVTLNHPHVVKTFEWGITSDGEQFLVMEFVEGLGLSFLVDIQNELMQQNRVKFMMQLGEAIRYFHEQKWIHRDICPRNIMVTDGDNQIKLIDFGLAVPNTAPFQAPGNRTGTASYMAPELIKRVRTDQRIDIFSYAVTCFEMCSKRYPWEAAQTLEAVLQHMNTPPLDIREAVPGIDEQLAAAIMKGLALDPKNRWQTIDPMIYQFREAQERLFPKPARPKRPPGVSVLDEPVAAKKKAPAASPGAKPGITLAEDEPQPPPRQGTARVVPGITFAADDDAPVAAKSAPVKLPKSASPTPGITLADDDAPAPEKPRSINPGTDKPGIGKPEPTIPPKKKPPVPLPGISLADDYEPSPPKIPATTAGITLADDDEPATAVKPPVKSTGASAGQSSRQSSRQSPGKTSRPTPGITLADDQ